MHGWRRGAPSAKSGELMICNNIIITRTNNRFILFTLFAIYIYS